MSSTQAVSAQQTITPVSLPEVASSGIYMPEDGAAGGRAELFGDTLKANMESGTVSKEGVSGGSDLPSSGHELPPENKPGSSSTDADVVTKGAVESVTTTVKNSNEPSTAAVSLRQSENFEDDVAEVVSADGTSTAKDSLSELQDLVEEFASIAGEVFVDQEEDLEASSNSHTVSEGDAGVDAEGADIADEAITPVTVNDAADQLSEELDARTVDVLVEAASEDSKQQAEESLDYSVGREGADPEAVVVDELLSDQAESEADSVAIENSRAVERDQNVSAGIDSKLEDESLRDSGLTTSGSEGSVNDEAKGREEKGTEPVPVAPSVVAMLKERHPELSAVTTDSEADTETKTESKPNISQESVKTQTSNPSIDSTADTKPSVSEQEAITASQKAASMDRPVVMNRPTVEPVPPREPPAAAKPQAVPAANGAVADVGVQSETNAKAGSDSASADSRSSRESVPRENQRFSLAALKEELASVSIKESGVDAPFKGLSSTSLGTTSLGGAASSGAVPLSTMPGSQAETIRGLGLSNFQQLQHAYKGEGSNTVSLSLSERFGSEAWTPGVSQRVSWMANQQIGRAELRLDPPELGSLNIRLTIHQDQASLSISSPSAQVREVLEQQMPRLREMLADSGIDLQEADVSDQSASQQSDKQSTTGGGEEFHSDAADDHQQTESEVNSSSLSLVDYYA